MEGLLLVREGLLGLADFAVAALALPARLEACAAAASAIARQMLDVASDAAQHSMV